MNKENQTLSHEQAYEQERIKEVTETGREILDRAFGCNCPSCRNEYKKFLESVFEVADEACWEGLEEELDELRQADWWIYG